MTLTVLITGFGPFPGAAFNPTAQLARRLALLRRPAFSDLVRISHMFATSYAVLDTEMPALMARHRPDIVLLFGLVTRTPHLRIEMRAVNRRSTLFADVAGQHPRTLAISREGPASLRGRAPHQHLVIAARSAGVPVRLSRDAGKYLCNFAYWQALELTQGLANKPLVLFVHVPKVGTAPRPRYGSRHRSRSLTPADLSRAGEAILRELVASARKRAIRRS